MVFTFANYFSPKKKTSTNFGRMRFNRVFYHILSVTLVNTFIMAPMEMTPLVQHEEPSVQSAKTLRAVLPAMPKVLQDVPSVTPKPGAKMVVPHGMLSVQPAIPSKSMPPSAQPKISQDQPTVLPKTSGLNKKVVVSRRLRKPTTGKIIINNIFLLFTNNYIVLCSLVDVSMEINAIKTRVCPNCGKMFDSVSDKWLHTSHCNTPFTTPSNCYSFFQFSC
jgi:hypothetical protein